MTLLMDKFFTKIGLEEKDLKKSSLRGFLYIGMVFMLGLISAFSIMTFLSWGT